MYRLLVVVLFASALAAPTFAQSPEQTKRERIISSYMLTFGRQPNQGELNHWMGRENLTVEQLVANHSRYLQSDANEKRATIRRAFAHAYGYTPSDQQVNQSMSSSFNYTDWMNNHTSYLRSNKKAWDDMIAKVYWNVCSRWATDNDRRSWKQSEAKPYMLVAAVVDVWHKENSWFGRWYVPSNSRHLTQVAISNPVANEVARVVAAGGANAVAAGGANVIAAGGGNVIAAGGGNVIAAGGGNVIAAGGLN